ncbi:MAG: hypothetical protein KAR64_03160 [Thermoplasmatales archaeon]|jgi:hypothetical protein|nr:hypothetical protein [Thermoplasmatales archaeon]MCK5258113.1 hypothetical protein [Thermoplasmatales archaeon]
MTNQNENKLKIENGFETKNYAFEILKMLLKSEIGEEVEIDFLGKNCVYKRVK